MHEIQIARYDEVAHELAEFDDPYRSRGDICAAAHEVEQAETQETREAFVDDFEGRHTPPYDALLGREVVRAKTGSTGILLAVRGSIVYTSEKNVHLFTRKEIILHMTTESRTK